MTCTIFENIFSKEAPHFITIDKALERIKSGKSRAKVEEIRNALDKEKANELKRFLPSVCFSGKFEKRYDSNMVEHSGFIVLDFDNVDVEVEMATFVHNKYTYAAWVSPSGNGIKVLVRIADGKKHREHFNALKEFFPTADNSGVNESRVCYESYDPNIHINRDAEIFTRTTVTEKIAAKSILSDEKSIFDKLLKWIVNKGGAFAKGERNTFIFKLASACCRFGIQDSTAEQLILTEYPTSNDFTHKEATNTIKSAYRSNSSKSGSAVFEKDVLVDKTTRKEIDITKIDMDAPPMDVVYGAHVKENALRIHSKGYESVKGINVSKIDSIFKMKRGEITCLTGIGNYGKSAWHKWNLLMRVLLYGEKFASFSPEDNPPEEYYHDFVEMLLGCNCTPFNPNGTVNESNPPVENYSNAYDFISKHIFYLYPKDAAPTPEYIKERFLELIFKEKIDGATIDPFNQMSHDYGARSDKYLESVLGDFSRFAQSNNIFFNIIAHPKQMKKDNAGNYECPDIFDINDGAMWNNKLDNLLVYHRPFKQSEPSNPAAEFHGKKIKRQKIVGVPGFVQLDYIRSTRRYEIDGHDPMGEILRKMSMCFAKTVEQVNRQVVEYKPQNAFAGFQKQTERVPQTFWNETD